MNLNYILLLTIAVLTSITITFGILWIFYKPDKFTTKRRAKELYINKEMNNVFTQASKERKDRKKLADKVKVSEQFQHQFDAAGMPISASEFLMIWGSAVFIPLLFGMLVMGNVIVAAGLAGIGFAVPLAVFKKKIADRYAKFNQQFGDALITIINSLKSGFSFQQAMQSVAKDMDDPISTEFQRTLNEVDYGVSLEDAMIHMYRRIPSDDLKILISAVTISRKIGGNLSEVLQSIASTVKSRIQIKQEVSSLSAQGKMSALIIGVLPIAISLIIMVVNPSYIDPLLGDPRGKMMLVVAVIMEVTGYRTMQRITNVSL